MSKDICKDCGHTFDEHNTSKRMTEELDRAAPEDLIGIVRSLWCERCPCRVLPEETGWRAGIWPVDQFRTPRHEIDTFRRKLWTKN